MNGVGVLKGYLDCSVPAVLSVVILLLLSIPGSNLQPFWALFLAPKAIRDPNLNPLVFLLFYFYKYFQQISSHSILKRHCLFMTQFKSHRVELLIGTYFFRTTYKYCLRGMGRRHRKSANSDSKFNFNPFLQSIWENQIWSFQMHSKYHDKYDSLKWENVSIVLYSHSFISILSTCSSTQSFMFWIVLCCTFISKHMVFYTAVNISALCKSKRGDTRTDIAVTNTQGEIFSFPKIKCL